MKKIYLLMAAASAIMLTACSSEDDVVQSAAQQANTTQAVGFDVFTQNVTNVTRAGLEGSMTTSRMQRSEQYGGGFGVYAYLTEDAITGAGYGNATPYGGRTTPVLPNFMVNEKLLWNTVNQGWYYNPLKYWPNETDNDSQTTPAQMIGSASTSHIDRLTFFAYAPYVPTGFTPGSTGITKITDKAGKLGGAGSVVEASIGYKAAIDNPDDAVDLLWGVAPAGGLTYTAVNGATVSKNEGEPLIDMTKPDVNTNMKFLFQHALARIGVKAVAAIDQVGAGGKLDPNTKITIDEITLTGYFGEVGVLNLDNPIANVANWVNIGNSTAAVDLVAGTTRDDLKKTTLTLRAQTTTAEPLAIAEHLRFKGTHASPIAQTDRVGVTTVKQDVIEPSKTGDATHDTDGPWITSKTYGDGELKYSETTPYYKTTACTSPATTLALGSATGKWFTLDQKGVYTEANATGKATTYTYPNVLSYYDVIFHEVSSTEADDGTYATYTAYVLDKGKGTDTANEDDGDTFTPKADIPVAGDYVITASELKAPYYDDGTYYKRDANYFMVVPTNNIQNICKTGITSAADLQALRTVRVKIKYYITTEDASLEAGRAQTENIIEKDVVFPSLANGKSYNLNMVLGLTSVKMEAEVDDWKVINVQADLPQNTAE